MKLKQIFEQASVCDDEKARRVLNVSVRPANITAEEIEAGITIERLCSICVPVFRYATQATVHGKLPDFDPESRPGGYKSIFRNNNGSLGVRYVAIDGLKKQTIVKACTYTESRKWVARINSTGLEVTGYFETKEECIAAYRAFPANLIYGGVTAAAGVLGGFYVIASVGAIPQANLWPFINALWSIPSEAELAARIKKSEDERAAAQKRFEEQRVAAKAARDEAKRKAAATFPNAPLTRLPTGPCSFVYLSALGDVVRPTLYVLAKRGPSLCYSTQAYTGQKTFTPSGKMHRFDSIKRKSIEDAVSAGFVFHP